MVVVAHAVPSLERRESEYITTFNGTRNDVHITQVDVGRVLSSFRVIVWSLAGLFAFIVLVVCWNKRSAIAKARELRDAKRNKNKWKIQKSSSKSMSKNEKQEPKLQPSTESATVSYVISPNRDESLPSYQNDSDNANITTRTPFQDVENAPNNIS
mmetsp:Transcript_27447/g.27670  ORF Transcript_27447/g.27670 Transcript_27447/m.27670 type:complete len:156 (+) Transcript_27447:125-592(+)